MHLDEATIHLRLVFDWSEASTLVSTLHGIAKNKSATLRWVGFVIVNHLLTRFLNLTVQTRELFAAVADCVDLFTKTRNFTKAVCRALFFRYVAIRHVEGRYITLGHGQRINLALLYFLSGGTNQFANSPLQLCGELIALLDQIRQLFKIAVDPDTLHATRNVTIQLLHLCLAQQFIWHTAYEECFSLIRVAMLRRCQKLFPQANKVLHHIVNVKYDPCHKDVVHNQNTCTSLLLLLVFIHDVTKDKHVESSTTALATLLPLDRQVSSV